MSSVRSELARGSFPKYPVSGLRVKSGVLLASVPSVVWWTKENKWPALTPITPRPSGTSAPSPGF